MQIPSWASCSSSPRTHLVMHPTAVGDPQVTAHPACLALHPMTHGLQELSVPHFFLQIPNWSSCSSSFLHHFLTHIANHFFGSFLSAAFFLHPITHFLASP